MPSIPVEEFRKNIPALPQLQGITVTDAEPGRAAFTFVPPADLANFHGNVHGGLVYTFCEICAGMVATSLEKNNVALNGSINYIRRCLLDEEIFVEGVAEHNGRSTVVVRVTVRNAAEKTVAEAMFTLFVLQ